MARNRRRFIGGMLTRTRDAKGEDGLGLISSRFMLHSIGVDLGGTNLRAAAIDSNGTLLEEIWGTTDLHLGRDAVIGDIITSIQQLREKSRRGPGGRRRRSARIH